MTPVEVSGAVSTLASEKLSPVLSVRNLRVGFTTTRGRVEAVRSLNFDLYPRRTLAVVGESGSGKTVSMLSILGLVPTPPGIVTSDSITYQGRAIHHYSQGQLRALRGSQIGMIFQDSQSSLNPRMRVGAQVAESLRVIRGESATAARRRVLELFELVRLRDPERVYRAYPHQLSGGMRQRVMIASALVLDPDVLFADEPTTALDVTLQFEIMQLIAHLKAEVQLSVVFITHDLRLVADYADDILVMYAGRAVESGSVEEVLRRPSHPYTAGLLKALPSLKRSSDRLQAIPGSPPSVIGTLDGCSFAPRCALVTDQCSIGEPLPRRVGHGGIAACFNPVPENGS